ncbi:MAG: DNA translocase FtsK, partial [Lachnospiraceae bacterium]|nr:DNA translocase FtsK [Lachnospiraceae bacterium]
MAASGGRKSSSNKKRTGSTSGTRSAGQRKKAAAAQAAQDSALFHEIGLIVLFAAMVFLFCCNFGIIGPVGLAVSGVLFGLFGLTAYVMPVLLFLAAAFWFANEGNPNAARKLIAGIVLFVMAGIVCDLAVKAAGSMETYNAVVLYENCREQKNGGGILAGSLSFLLQHYLGTLGTVLVVILCCVISLILLTEKSLLGTVKRGGSRMRELSREDAQRRRELAEVRRQEQEENAQRRREQTMARRQAQEEQRARKAEERRLKAEEKENEKILRMERKVSGVMLDTALSRPEDTVQRRDDIHEIMLAEEELTKEGDYAENAARMPETNPPVEEEPAQPEFAFEKVRIRGVHQVTVNEEEYPEETAEAPKRKSMVKRPEAQTPETAIRIHKEQVKEPVEQETGPAEEMQRPEVTHKTAEATPAPQGPKPYMFPPITLLQKGKAAAGDSERELKETALRLQQTLNTFGVKVTITDISQGPSVTRYELQPEQGVKVSKIVGLADDIKLNLAAIDVRIEAPIPGKAAVGIEVPNKENATVSLRDLLETKEFRDFQSKIAFAVGKDIAGKVVVSDIAKMPHMLIAGATGSGKSVCINTLIMSILYKAHPDDVKLIMVDPKVVELSIYNGIPHLLIPVVTDPKKASAALHWGVSEMEDRYRKFADYNVRDLKGYNKKVESMREKGDENAPKKLPQIVIIVDELADLMMVCPGEVEESICRLAQLARACGIHLIIATQRPSVDVITGLIKANMPSRVAFSVSSGVDSRTILDMVGAEKLLGKGDMLFYPQGYSKPARVQGAFVSDQEVSDVVDFLKNQALGNTYA